MFVRTWCCLSIQVILLFFSKILYEFHMYCLWWLSGGKKHVGSDGEKVSCHVFTSVSLAHTHWETEVCTHGFVFQLVAYVYALHTILNVEPSSFVFIYWAWGYVPRFMILILTLSFSEFFFPSCLVLTSPNLISPTLLLRQCVCKNHLDHWEVILLFYVTFFSLLICSCVYFIVRIPQFVWTCAWMRIVYIYTLSKKYNIPIGGDVVGKHSALSYALLPWMGETSEQCLRLSYHSDNHFMCFR